jgi:3-oxoacyl-[acyl-carrier protein] reductase
VLAFAHAGATVVTCYRQPGDTVDSLVKELAQTDAAHQVIQADVAREADVDRLISESRTHCGALDVIVNNAGTISHVPFAELDLREWQRVVDGNLTTAYQVVRTALPVLSPGSSIINVGSRVATVGLPLRAHYTTAKAGLIGLTRSLAKELGPQGHRVNLVAPGPVETEEEIPAQTREQYARRIALGRLGRPDEIAAAVLFLASDLSSFITGETLNVDGGI